MAAADLPEDVRAVGRQVREIAPSLRKAGDRHPGPAKAAHAGLLRITQDRKRGARAQRARRPLSP